MVKAITTLHKKYNTTSTGGGFIKIAQMLTVQDLDSQSFFVKPSHPVKSWQLIDNEFTTSLLHLILRDKQGNKPYKKEILWCNMKISM